MKAIEKKENLFRYENLFLLESGAHLPGFELHYTTYGNLNEGGDNVVWVCHALTGSSDFTSWWGELFSDESTLNPHDHMIIGVNLLGGCYGSTGPLSVDPTSGAPFLHQFPRLTNRDAVRAFDLLRRHLNINTIKVLIGGSLGGQQVLEWSIMEPNVFKNIVLMACNAAHSPWGIAFNEAQRMAIESDPSWRSDQPDAGKEGLKTARAIGMISYRHYFTFLDTQTEDHDEVGDHFKASSYQRYQGEKLVRRFNAYTYYLFTKMMDNHHIGRGRKGIKEALKTIRANALVVGIDTDILFPVQEQRLLAEHIPNASLEIISSRYGHDGFLVEFDAMDKVIGKFLRQTGDQVFNIKKAGNQD